MGRARRPPEDPAFGSSASAAIRFGGRGRQIIYLALYTSQPYRENIPIHVRFHLQHWSR